MEILNENGWWCGVGGDLKHCGLGIGLGVASLYSPFWYYLPPTFPTFFFYFKIYTTIFFFWKKKDYGICIQNYEGNANGFIDFVHAFVAMKIINLIQF